jgi:hypothetical protein
MATFIGVLSLIGLFLALLDLRKLKKQLDNGVITPEEYEQKKKKLQIRKK